MRSPEEVEKGDEEEEYKFIESEEAGLEELNQDAFESMIAMGEEIEVFDNNSFQYQWTLQPSQGTVQRNKKNKKE